ncbi:MAG: SIMPL domain-containing protein [Cyanophyceae cyanobacterium]
MANQLTQFGLTVFTGLVKRTSRVVLSTATSGVMWGLVGTAIAPMGATVVAQLAVMPEAVAQTAPQRIISVGGRGAVAIPSTHALITLGIEVQGRDASDTQAQLAAQSNRVVNWLNQQPIEDLQTQSISLSPRYDRNSVLIGYTARTMLTLRTAIADSGTIIDGSVKNGATRINNISLTATPEALQKARRQALALAAQSAQEEADIVLESLGLSRQEIMSIQVQGAPTVQFASRGDFATAEAGAPPVPVVGGEQTVSAFISLQIRY